MSQGDAWFLAVCAFCVGALGAIILEYAVQHAGKHLRGPVRLELMLDHACECRAL